MAYNRESFLAGLAVGRAMWRPPMQTGEVPVEVRWTADPEYLVYDAGLWLGHARNYLYNYNYYKTSNGKAIGVFGVDYTYTGLGCYGPILISLDPASTHYNWSGTAGSVVIDGITWYVNNGQWITEFGSIIEWETDLVEFGPDEGPDMTAIVRKILDLAHVRIFIGG